MEVEVRLRIVSGCTIVIRLAWAVVVLVTVMTNALHTKTYLVACTLDRNRIYTDTKRQLYHVVDSLMYAS